MDKNDLDDYLHFTKVKFNQSPNEEPYAHFAQVVSNAERLVDLLNEMFLEGISFKSILGKKIMLGNALQLLPLELKKAQAEFGKCKDRFKALLQTKNKLKRLFFMNFEGKNLSLLTKDNLPHFLRYISKHIQLNNLKLTSQITSSAETTQKIEFLDRVWELNRDLLSEPLSSRPSKCLLQSGKLYYTCIAQRKTHKYLVYFYKELFGQELECNKVFFCNESTSWTSLKRKPPATS